MGAGLRSLLADSDDASLLASAVQSSVSDDRGAEAGRGDDGGRGSVAVVAGSGVGNNTGAPPVPRSSRDVWTNQRSPVEDGDDDDDDKGGDGGNGGSGANQGQEAGSRGSGGGWGGFFGSVKKAVGAVVADVEQVFDNPYRGGHSGDTAIERNVGNPLLDDN